NNNPLQDAIRYTDNSQYYRAIAIYEDWLLDQKTDTFVIAKLADCYFRVRNFPKTLFWYSKLDSLGVMTEQFVFQYVQILKTNQKYTEATEKCKYYLAKFPEAKLIEDQLKQLSEINTFYADSANWKVTYINTNSEYRDFSPVFFRDQMAFISARPDNSGRFVYEQTDAMRAQSIDGQRFRIFSSQSNDIKADDVAGIKDENCKVISVKSEEKEDISIGPAAFSKDGNMAFLTLSKKERNKSWVGIKEALYRDKKLYIVNSFKYNNPEFVVQHPALSPDGQYLYFASNQATGLGGFDLYYCKRGDTGWSTPVNLGKQINTSGNEVFPTVNAQGDLYFSSDGLPGLGALDLFFVKMQNGIPIGAPVNLGCPLNSAADDFGIAISFDKTYGYLSSNRDISGDDNIYRFEYKVEFAITNRVKCANKNDLFLNNITKWPYIQDSGSLKVNKSLFKGKVIDGITKMPVENALVSIRPVSGKEVIYLYSNSNGSFISTDVNVGKSSLEIQKLGYQVYRTETDVRGGSTDSAVFILLPDTLTKATNRIGMLEEKSLQILSDSLKVPIVDRTTINFNFNKSDIRKRDSLTLHLLIERLKNDPNLHVAIEAFTDCKGDSLANQRLARKRAIAVRSYLIKYGIASSKIDIEFFSKIRLMIPCDEESYNITEQIVNRRADIFLIHGKRKE
ncbi:MAG TPA: OmpA family protein, partial [Paludibacter sp.]|nr:OmpA family protein [Paludibacter sp.]